jgi:hypothetical protein
MIEKEITETGNCRVHLSSLGNWCGHDPNNPQFYTPPEQHGTRPDVILLAIEGVENFFWSPKSYLKSLLITNPSTRQERSEARERDAIVLAIILHYLELAKMWVGVPLKDGHFHSLSIKDIALRAGWRKPEDDDDPKHKDKGLKRTWRALKSLKRAGYITVHRRVEKLFEGEEEYRSLPAIRCVNPKLFHELKVSIQRLNTRRKQASNRVKKMYRESLAKIEEELKRGTKEALNALFSFNKNLNGQYSKPRKSTLARGLAALATFRARLKAEGKLPIPDTS